jgi:hypothetical protein
LCLGLNGFAGVDNVGELSSCRHATKYLYAV